MDALKRPLVIPPEFSRYAEEKGLFELYERMLAELLVARPDDPLSFLLEFLSQSKNDGKAVDRKHCDIIGKFISLWFYFPYLADLFLKESGT